MEESETGLGLGLNIAFATLILLSAGIFVAETYPLPVPLAAGLRNVDWLLLAVFVLEYAIRLWAAERPFRYAISPYAIVDLVSILPLLTGVFDMRSLRLIRWLTGIILIPSQVGSLIQYVNRIQTVNALRCKSCGLSNHESDAIYWRRCGTQLPETP